jgi:hypothetical protein
MLAHARLTLIKNAADAALTVNQQLDKLLDAYDFYMQRYETETPSQELELKDLQVSIMALGSLPLQLANRLDDWTRDVEPELSTNGFEIYVINELSLHMFSVATFFWRKHIETDVDHQVTQQAFNSLREVNKSMQRST